MDKEALTFIILGTPNSGLWMVGELIKQAGHTVHILCPSYPNKVEGMKVNLSDVDVILADDEILAQRGKEVAEMGVVYWPTSTLLTWLMTRLNVDPQALFDEKIPRPVGKNRQLLNLIWRRKNGR